MFEGVHDTSPDDLSFISGSGLVAPLWTGLERGSIACHNFIHRHKEINILGQQFETHEQKKGPGFWCSYVMFIRHDASWLKDLDVDLMLQVTGGRRHSAAGRGHMFLELLITWSLPNAQVEKVECVLFWGGVRGAIMYFCHWAREYI